ncbi:MAG TPA: DNA-3-methyladenine glycosylase I [Gemmatimonadales bacterium]|nr:DNA-3-methyladenine glycosylase I [Gemmatimonadales bacterium]
MIKRCAWSADDPLMIEYHDTEWGVPVHGDKKLFAKLILDGFQAGLSWRVILHKREAFYEAFDGLDPEKVARYDARRRAKLLKNPGIVRNRAKVGAAVTNARAFLALRDKGETLDRLLWDCVGGAPITNARKALRGLPAETRESRLMSVILSERGFKFVGPTICYAFMQAVGMVNDHLVACFRHGEV